jgi:hypothetical protein
VAATLNARALTQMNALNATRAAARTCPRLPTGAWLAWLALATGNAFATTPALRDPTLPPLRVAPAAAAAAAAEAPLPLRLQMIVRTGESRRALIGGRRSVSVAAGDEFDTGAGRARVLRVTDSSVFLAYADRRERLDLHPELRSAPTPRSGP